MFSCFFAGAFGAFWVFLGDVGCFDFYVWPSLFEPFDK